MIGVIASSSEHAVVAEFFELFKTPWEPFTQGRQYPVVIATTEEIPEVDAQLLMVFGSRRTNVDSAYEITVGQKLRYATLDYDGEKLPTYGETILLSACSAVTCVSTEGGSAGVLL